MLRGSDPRREQTGDIVTALSIISVGGSGQRRQIYNGADDDASGTTAVLELARAERRAQGSATAQDNTFCALRLGGTWRLREPLFLDHLRSSYPDVANLEF